MVLKDMRKEKRMTQKELGRLTGYSQNTISNHENGVRSLGEKEIERYSEAFGITKEEFALKLSEYSKTNESLVKNLPRILVGRMHEKGITEEELINATNIPKKKFKSLLNGTLSNIYVNQIYLLSEILDISIRNFFEDLDYLETNEEYQNSIEMKEKIDKDFFTLQYSQRKELYDFFNNLLHK
ncbi:hypothetical protein C7P63_08955 [Vagococcus humatus]|uniref:HTH cro/C1-type domain-containing protein n=2 Tax=Vagococcus humatus TaxID=1889241 RepID=A0A3S0GCN5_9ENTE|nr:hypothetical protein C7P63_08955 [Vagococcus humatus]